MALKRTRLLASLLAVATIVAVLYALSLGDSGPFTQNDVGQPATPEPGLGASQAERPAKGLFQTAAPSQSLQPGAKIDNSLALAVARQGPNPPAVERSVSVGGRQIRFDASNRVQTYIYLQSTSESALDELRALGAEVELLDEQLSMVQAWVPVERIDQVASLADVNRIGPPDYGAPRTGSVNTQGDAILRSNQLRGLGVLGAGVKVGIISDGANGLAVAQASGDLPAGVNVYGSCSVSPPDHAVCDVGSTCNEGTAMAEIVHDLAPAAQLAIAGASTSLEFIQQIGVLANTFGADIIVDDLGFYVEPYFADGPVAAAVAAVANQVIFVSAAGNDGTGHYEANYLSTIVEGDDVHDFGATAGQASDPTQDVTIAPGEFLLTILQWNDPFAGSANDYDLYLVNTDETDLLCPSCASEEFQEGTDDPVEGICYHNDTAQTVSGKLVVNKWSGANRRVEMFLLGRGEPSEFNVAEGGVFGHPGLSSVLAVGAINASEPGNDAAAVYSSRGGSRVDFPTMVVRPKPDLAAIDGVAVTGAAGFPSTFFGTSAAAPHVAGVAAQLLSLAGASKAEVKGALLGGVVDLGVAGFDSTFGFGRLDSMNALAQIDADTDGIRNPLDNCMSVSNPDQLDFDADGGGDVCDADDDNDSVADSADSFPFNAAEWLDTDSDGVGNNADADDDGDGLSDADETNRYHTDPLLADTDGDGLEDGAEVECWRNPLSPDAGRPCVVPLPFLPLLL